MIEVRSLAKEEERKKTKAKKQEEEEKKDKNDEEANKSKKGPCPKDIDNEEPEMKEDEAQNHVDSYNPPEYNTTGV